MKMQNNQNTSYAITHRGAVRQLNEDSHIELNSHNIWVVADGMGGHEAGDFASQLVIDAISTEVQQLLIQEVTIEHIVKAIEHANGQLIEHSNKYLGDKTAGSTVVVLFIKDNTYHVIWVGDSRVYLYRDNHLIQLSRDHSQVNELIANGVILESEAKGHPLSNVITRAVGVTAEIDVDFLQDSIQDNDLFLLCSDGLTGELSDQEISSVIDPKSIIDSGMALMHASLVRGAQDNVTCVLVKHDANAQPVDDLLTERSNERTIPVFKK